MVITKEDFQDYESVRNSGVTNMWDTPVVGSYSGLDDEQIKYIRQHYTELDKKWPDVRGQVL